MCGEFLYNPILMDAIQDEEQLVVDGRAGTAALSNWDQLNLRTGQMAAVPKQLYINETFSSVAQPQEEYVPPPLSTQERVTPTAPAGTDRCECAVTSVSREVRTKGREQFVDLTPSYVTCEHCKNKTTAGAEGGQADAADPSSPSVGGQVMRLLGSVAAATWSVVAGK